MVRYVLRLPREADEAGLRVQLVAGKTVAVDGRNRYQFGGKIRPVVIEGWGFTRHVVSALGPMAGTLMAVDPAEPKVERFVAIGGEPYLVRYDSRLPIVVYAPEGVEVRYRIWTAGPEPRPLEKG
jgi:ecotin